MDKSYYCVWTLDGWVDVKNYREDLHWSVSQNYEHIIRRVDSFLSENIPKTSSERVYNCFWPTKHMIEQYILGDNDICITLRPNFQIKDNSFPIRINLFTIVRITKQKPELLQPLRNAKKKKFFHC